MSIYDPLAKALGIEPIENPSYLNEDYDPKVYGDHIPGPFSGQKHTEESRSMIARAHMGKTYSQDTLEKMRLAKVGKKMSDETKRKMSESRLGDKNGFFGKKHTQETIEKIKEKTKQYTPWNKGVVGVVMHTEESKQKISSSLQGRPCSEETRRKMSESRRLYWENKHNGKT
jgi:hypothetical protein